MRLLQLLCENHNSDLQNYLRFQTKSNNSYNIIEAVEILFEKLIIEMSKSSYLVFSKCLDTLTEMIQGPCEENQMALINCKFLQTAKKFLEVDQSNPSCNLEQSDEQILEGNEIVHLKYKLSITLLSLLEINKDDQIIALMSRMDLEDLITKNIKQSYDSFLETKQTEYTADIFTYFMRNERIDNKDTPDKNNEPPWSIIEAGFNYYHLLLYLEDYKKKSKDSFSFGHSTPAFGTHNLIKSLKNCWEYIKESVKEKVRKVIRTKKKDEIKDIEFLKFFEKHTGRVEISYESRLILIYFILRPEALFLTDEIKDDFHKTVDRSSEKSKLQYLQIATNSLGSKIKNEQWLNMLFRRYPLVSMVIANVHLWSYLSFTLTLLLNYILIASYHMPYTSDIEPKLCLSTDKYGDCSSEASALVTSNIFLVLGILHFIFSGLVFIFHALKMGPGLYSSNYTIINSIMPAQLKGVTILVTILLTSINPMIFYYFLTSIISLIAVVQKLYGLYCIQMLDIIFRFPSLLNVVKSIYYSRKALILTFLFNVVIIYYFTLWGYSRLNAEYDGQCPDLKVCMAKTYDQGLKLGMGYVFKKMNAGTYNVERFFFENLYYIVIFTCLMNFIKGIIYDAFFVLRDESDRNAEDKEHLCFICGLDRELIEKNSRMSFKHHVENDHNEWNYAFYMMYVTKKEKTELSSIESYVRRHLETNNILWFPQKEGISIMAEKEEVDTMTKEIEDIKATILKLQKEFEEIKDHALKKSSQTK